jgi:hypothetical protein
MLQFARALMILGVLILVAGGLLYLAAKINLPLGRLPGDIILQRGNFTCIFPLATSILLSVLLTFLLRLLVKYLNR